MYEPQFDAFLYDVTVGPGRDPGDNFPESIRRMALQLSKRRIDVVGVAADSVEIFELTQSAGLKAAGQAIVYPHLLLVTWELTIPVTTTIICRQVQDDIEPVLQSYGVRLVIIPPRERV